jgi:protein O-GlcNAc transferase
MATVAEVYAQALQNHQAGNLPLAEQLYVQILRADPRHADAHHLLGALALQTGRFELAVRSIGQAVAINPASADYHCNLGLARQTLGQRDQAVTSYREALRLRPDFAEAHNNLGNVLQRQGESNEAVAHLTKAVQLRPHYAEAQNNLGMTLWSLGRLEDAAAHWQQALAIRPDYPEAANNLAAALLSQKKPQEAVMLCRQALRSRPDFPEAHNNLANALCDLGMLEEAVTHSQEALRLHPHFAAAFNTLGNVLLRQGKLEAAARHCQQALRLCPTLAEAHYNLGNACRDLGKLEEAAVCYRNALQLQTGYPAAHNNLGDILLKQGFPELALANFRKALELEPGLGAAQRNLLFYLNYDPQANPDEVFAAHCRWGKQHESKTPVLPHQNEPGPDRRLRIGYVSPDLRQHALTRYLEPVLAHHDPDQVEVFCYAEVTGGDAVTARLQSLAHGWRSTCNRTDAQVAQCIRDDAIDILVDLAGHTCNSRLTVFAHKPAPVQAAWLGYLNTTGLTRVDFRLTDEVLDPPGQPVRDTEELLRLPEGMCCFAPPADAPAVGALPAERNGHLTFGSVHSLFKLNASVLDLWAELLKALPKSRLLMFRDTLTAAAQQRIRRQFTDRGIAGERLDLRQGSPAPGYLGVYGEIDVSLDTFPYTGGVTTCESLWMGVPVLSLCGVRPATRNSAALLARAGIGHWAVQTSEEYLAFAKQVAQEPHGLAELRAGLRERMTATLCDADRFTASLEKAYRDIWRRWCTSRLGQ